jgi:hypothetical protein
MLESVWNSQVRILPLVLALAIFGLLHLAHRLTRFAYTPSYFAVFPLSILDYQLSVHFGEFYGGEYLTAQKGRRPNNSLFVKSLLSFFLTFFFIPLLIGTLVSSFLLPGEFLAFLALLLLWEGSNCLSAVLDFSSYRGSSAKIWLFFGSFYTLYLLCLFIVPRFSYRFARPFFVKGDIRGLLSSIESMLVPFLISVVVIGVLGGILTHWFLNKDAIAPEVMDDDLFVENGDTHNLES